MMHYFIFKIDYMQAAFINKEKRNKKENPGELWAGLEREERDVDFFFL